jgi:non-specific serine/threonine protein kinase/serine/threonine-protein kinase
MLPGVRKLFDAAAELPADQRARYLDEHAADDAVRQQVEALLAADCGESLVVSAVGQAARELLAEPRELRLGPYRTMRLLGRGGMGAVYLAVRTDGAVDKQVAIKVVHPGLESASALDRFYAERQILANLSHPRIAALYDAGTSEDGRPWFAMEYVDGQPIDVFADARRLGVRERVELFLKVLDAVEHAHGHVVIHRDLKPANILVGADGNPKLLDFGIAKVLGEAEVVNATRILTPEFAAPEQVRGQSITTATDTFLAGGVLYKLLTGANPHNLAGATAAQAEEIICERDATPPRQLNARLDRDLENIVLKALRREPGRRYVSVTLFALDLRRYLDGLPVSATPDSLGYRARRFVARHRVVVAAAAFCFVALAGGVAATAYQAAVARRHFQEVRSLANQFLFEFENEIHDLPGTTKARDKVIKTAQKYLANLYSEAPGDPKLMREVAQGYAKLAALEGGTYSTNTGEYKDSLEHFRRAIQLFERLGDGSSSDTSLRRNLCRLHASMAVACLNAGQDEEARRTSLAGANLGEAFVRDSQSLDALIGGYNSIRTHASILAAVGEANASYDYFHRAIRVVESWLSRHPGDRTSNGLIADAMFNLSEVQDLFGDRAGAAASAKRGVDLADELIATKSTPQLINLRVLLVGQYGKALSELGLAEWPEAQKQLRRGVDLATQLYHADTANRLAFGHYIYEKQHLGAALAAHKDARGIDVLLEARREVANSASHEGDGDQAHLLNGVNGSLSDAWLRTDPRLAIEAADAALKYDDAVLKESPSDAQALQDRAAMLVNQAEAHRALKQDAGPSIESARAAVDALRARSPALGHLAEMTKRLEKLLRGSIE